MSAANATYDILLPLPLDKRFAYRGNQLVSAAGQFVEVPFGKRNVTGLVIGPGTDNIAPDKLKDIIAPAPLPPLTAAFRQFLLWSAHYTMNPPGLMLKMTVAGTALLSPPPGETTWQRATAEPPKFKANSKAARLWSLLTQEPTLTEASLTAAGLERADAHAFVKRGLLTSHNVPAPPSPWPNPDHAPPALTVAQRQASNALIAAFAAPKPILLQGVTGSGKTEVYCEAIAATLRQGKQALVLMPEIALTTAMLARFTARFGVAPTLWHSDVPDKQRRANWWAIARGEAGLVVGARSALFLPYATLGLIVVDEEHEAAYKQEEGVIYHARDMAVARAHHEKIPIILASATPSIESHVNATQGRYQLLRLPERFGGARLPTIHRIDMRAESLPATRFLSEPLLTALRTTLDAGEQAMLFLNRRGYAPLTLCRACGHRLQCPQCTAWLVQHKHSKQLHCHHCGHRSVLPQHCPACRAEDKFAPCGPGVERVAEEVHALLPQARAAIMSSDLLDSPAKIAALLERIARHDIDLLIGTQIMAKGYHFPDMTLVGIVDADLGLHGGDPRASERCYQLLQQVAGRTGRAEKPGRAYLQTWQPDHPVMAALANNDHAAFMAAELQERAAYDLPPYKRLAGLTFSAPHAHIAETSAGQFVASIPGNANLRVLGPAPAPLALLRGQHRVRVLLIADRTVPLQPTIHATLARIKLPNTLKLLIDIDPYSFY